MLNPLPSTATQTHTSGSLPRVKLQKSLSPLRRSSVKPYFYSSTGEIRSNLTASLITCTTSPKNPLKYRALGSKVETNSSFLVPMTAKSKIKSINSFVLRPKMVNFESSLIFKEIFVTEDASLSNEGKLSGFFYKIRKTPMTRPQKQENTDQFLKICRENLNKSKKYKFLFTATGKLFQFLQDFPFNEQVLIVSTEMYFSGLQSSNIEDLIPLKPPNSAFKPVRAGQVPVKSSSKALEAKLSLNQLKVKLGQTAVKIDTKLPKLFDLGMEKLRLKCRFSEAELHKLYAKYKMLVHLSIAKNPSHDIFAGISKETFIESYQGSKELSFVLSRIFDCIDLDRSGNIDWEEYLHAMDIMSNGNYEQQIDLFFQVYDTDGNGVLSFNEIQELCKLQLQNSDADNVIDELAFSFASLIFDITETAYDQEIPAEKIKIALGKQGDKSLVEMFCSFSFLKIK